MNSLKERALKYYRENEAKVDIGFFLSGFFFDIFTLADVDDGWGIAQQLVYLFLLGLLLYFDFLHSHKFLRIHPRLQRLWDFRQLATHFLLGSLLSLYSLFFLKSASFFSSIIFVIVLVGIMIANELQAVQKRGVNIKMGLYVICLFSFFSITVPVALGFVGYLPFILSLLLTCGVLYGAYRLLLRKISDAKILVRALLGPGAAVVGFFFLFYMFGLIPPVPLSAMHMGIYHNVERVNGQYLVSHQNEAWNFWRKEGDKEFFAQPNDKIYFFAQIFSPARFSDSVILHWFYKDPKAGWQSTDKIPMPILGGRKLGYRGFAVKQNYGEGEYRVSIETTDGREIGRIYFEVFKVPATAARTFYRETY